MTVSYDKNEGIVDNSDTLDTEAKKVDAAGGNGFTLFYTTPKEPADIQQVIRNIIFKPYHNKKMDISFVVSGNKTTGFDGSNISDITYNPDNGHYYLRYGSTYNTWVQDYDRAKTYIFNGRKGYMLTCVYGDEEYNALRTLGFFNGNLSTNIGASRLKDKTDALPLRDPDKINTNNIMASEGYPYLYYNCGPDAGKLYKVVNIVPGEGNNSWGVVLVGKQGTMDNDFYTPYNVESVVEFGGYPEGKDPGGYTKTLETRVTSNDTVALDAEAMIGTVKYAPLSYALEVAKDGDTVKVVKDTVSADKNVAVKKGVKIQYKKDQTDETKVYTVAKDAKVDVNPNGTITLTDGTLNLFQNAPMQVTSPVDQKTYDVTGPYCPSTIVVNAAAKESPYITGAR